MKRVKFKYLQEKIKYLPVELFEEEYKEVKNPLPYNNLPDGLYQIRGNKKNTAKYYYLKENRWFLSEDKKRDNGHKWAEAGVYELFPWKSEKEYQQLRKCFKYLSPVWKRYVSGYFFWKQLRDTKRRSKKVLARIRVKNKRIQREQRKQDFKNYFLKYNEYRNKVSDEVNLVLKKWEDDCYDRETEKIYQDLLNVINSLKEKGIIKNVISSKIDNEKSQLFFKFNYDDSEFYDGFVLSLDKFILVLTPLYKIENINIK